jgi:hypothetical protein
MSESESKQEQPKEESKMLSLLPWLKLEVPIKVKEVVFTPYSIMSGDPEHVLHSFKKEIDRVLSSYRDIRGRIINECAIAYTDKKDPCSSAVDIRLVSNASHMLTFAALARKKFCVQFGSYANSSYFETVFQEFSKESEFVRIMTRRRDGWFHSMGHKHGEVKFAMPLECAERATPVFDDALLMSLGYVLEEKEPLARRLMQSIWLYNLACSDSHRISIDREIVLMVSAFEQLFSGCHGANDLACKVDTLLDNYGSTIVGNCPRINDIKLTSGKENLEKQWFIHRKWIQELYQLRNDYTHGDDPGRRSWGWNNLEHSLMAAFLFPLIAKILLSQQSQYSLVEADWIRMGAIDKLLNAQNWFGRDPATGISTWQKVISDHKFNSCVERAIEKIINKRESSSPGASQL